MRVNQVFYTLSITLLLLFSQAYATAGEPETPEEVLRTLVRANAEKDLTTMGAHMAHDPDMIGYTIGGRKYIGWPEFARDMELEFQSVHRLEIPISALNVWRRGETAWFAMELDYIRYVSNEQHQVPRIPLRETGVLERRNGKWILVAWHESTRDGSLADAASLHSAHSAVQKVRAASEEQAKPDLSGQWDIHEEERSYRAMLDRDGNGTYTWQNGKITTTGFADQKWQGTWQQFGNDREGGFEVLLSEDGTEAKGVWWYTRVGDRKNIPPRQWGGSYHWTRLTPPPDSVSTP
jgi:hypothetical protein